MNRIRLERLSKLLNGVSFDSFSEACEQAMRIDGNLTSNPILYFEFTEEEWESMQGTEYKGDNWRKSLRALIRKIPFTCCECGTEKLGLGGHSQWCPKYEGWK